MNELEEMTFERREEISTYMKMHLWVAQFVPSTKLWIMSKESRPYSQGPFEVMAVAKTLEEVFEKTKDQQSEDIAQREDFSE